jgi:hypothetical protein
VVGVGAAPAGVSRATAMALPMADRPMKMPPANPEMARETLERPSSWRALLATCSKMSWALGRSRCFCAAEGAAEMGSRRRKKMGRMRCEMRRGAVVGRGCILNTVRIARKAGG